MSTKPYTVKFAGRTMDCNTLSAARRLLRRLGPTAYIHYNEAGLEAFEPQKDEAKVKVYELIK